LNRETIPFPTKLRRQALCVYSNLLAIKVKAGTLALLDQMKPKIDTLTEIDGAKVLEYLRLTLNQKRTGATRHLIGGQDQPNSMALLFANTKRIKIIICSIATEIGTH